MSHKSGHIIIQSLREHTPLTSAQAERLADIEQRNEYSIMDRMYLGWITYTVAPLPADDEH